MESASSSPAFAAMSDESTIEGVSPRPTKKKAAIQRLDPGYPSAIREGLEWIGFGRIVSRDTRVFVKPNLTYPTFRPGVMTNPECLEALIVVLKDYTDRITVGEADTGGYNRFSMTEVFEEIGLEAMAKRYGFRLVNMSHLPSRTISFRRGARTVSMSLPAPVLDETDVFITVPVPKVHTNTIVSLSIKNQWGVIQEPRQRLRLHRDFARAVYEVNKALPPSISIVDGKFGLDRNGPLRGDVVALNWLLVSEDVYLADYLCCRLMGVDPRGVPHLRYIFAQEKITGEDQLEMNRDPRPFVTKVPFRLKRDWTDYPGVATFHSRICAYLGYESVLAMPLHWLLYRFREPFY